MREQLMNGMMAILVTVALFELAFAWKANKGVHTFRDTFSSLSLGVGQQAVNVYLSAAFLALYDTVHRSFALGQADMGVWWHWVLFVLGCDLCYYTAHRLSHRVNFFVAAHVVHHQALDFNHLSAMRQSWTAWVVIFSFFLPLAVLGVPVEMFAMGQLGIMFFQFMSHNGTFRGSLGVLDRLFVTPRNHRVHHGVNGPYLGANCGGMFVIWDRVFGTFVEEDPTVPVRMGAGFRVNFYDPFEANLDYYKRIVFVMKRRRTLWGKVAIWFQSPRVLISELRALGYVDPTAPAHHTALAARDMVVSGLALVGAIAMLAVHRLSYDSNPWSFRVLTGVAVMFFLWVLGRTLSGVRSEEGLLNWNGARSVPGTHSRSRR